MERDSYRKLNKWEQWAVFFRKFMPAPGMYKAQVVGIRGSKAQIILWKGKQQFLMQAELWYSPDAYKEMPKAEDDS